MNFDEASLIKSAPEQIARGSLNAENGLGGRRPKINDTVR